MRILWTYCDDIHCNGIIYEIIAKSKKTIATLNVLSTSLYIPTDKEVKNFNVRCYKYQVSLILRKGWMAESALGNNHALNVGSIGNKVYDVKVGSIWDIRFILKLFPLEMRFNLC